METIIVLLRSPFKPFALFTWHMQSSQIVWCFSKKKNIVYHHVWTPFNTYNKESLGEIHFSLSNVFQSYICVSILPVGKALFGAAAHISESIKFKMPIHLYRYEYKL